MISILFCSYKTNLNLHFYNSRCRLKSTFNCSLLCRAHFVQSRQSFTGTFITLYFCILNINNKNIKFPKFKSSLYPTKYKMIMDSCFGKLNPSANMCDRAMLEQIKKCAMQKGFSALPQLKQAYTQHKEQVLDLVRKLIVSIMFPCLCFVC